MTADSRVFITHSTLDKDLAEALVSYVRLATGLSASRVFCSSIDGFGIPTGQRFMTFIQEQLWNTALVVPLVTPAYQDSLFCQWELGAVWVRPDLPLFPIKVKQVPHSRLPAPLAELQVAEITTQGLRGLARQVCTTFGLTLEADVAESAAADLLQRYPGIMANLVTRWETTEQAQLRRAARYATSSKFLHRAFHLERDASFLLAMNDAREPAAFPSPHLAHQFVEAIREVTVALAAYFTEVTGTPCRITLKQFLAEEGDTYYVQDIARSAGRLRVDRDPIAGNTDFETILRADADYFRSNDLVEDATKGYQNTHGVPGVNLTYRSTIVWPIRKQLSNRDLATKMRSALPDHHLLGFLCVDSSSPGAFIDADFEIGAAVADSLYAILLPYLGSSQPTK